MPVLGDIAHRNVSSWSLQEQNARFNSSGGVAAAKWGGALPAGTSRAILASPVFDLKPWLQEHLSGVDSDFATDIDTSAACDLYDPHLHWLLYGATAARLADDADLGSVRIWMLEHGHPVDPQKAKYFRKRTEITAEFVAEVNDGWLYSMQPNGMRFWGGALVIEATTASLPKILYSASMH